MNCEDDDDWLGEKCMKLIHSNISHVEIYLSCCNVLMVSLIQSAKNNGL